MIPESREQVEQDSAPNIANTLQDYLRNEAPVINKLNYKMQDALYQRLMLKIHDYMYKYNINYTHEQVEQLASDAITKYINNWQGKVPGTDNRGKRLGNTYNTNKHI